MHGAGLINMLFMQPGGSVLEFGNRMDKSNNCFFSLAAALEHDFFYLPPPENSSINTIDVSIDIDMLKETLNLMVKGNHKTCVTAIILNLHRWRQNTAGHHFTA